MKYCRIIAEATPPAGSFGRLLDDGTTIELIEGDVLPRADAPPGGARVAVDEVTTWLPPTPPPDIVALGKNYAEHAKEGGGEVPDAPVVFLKATSTLVGHREPILLPLTNPDEVDYEAELAVVIGRAAKHVSRQDALSYVLGYTCAHDVSARDCQLRIDGQWARGKSFDTFCPLGPWIETEADPSDLAVRLRLNGEVMQEDTTKSLMFDVPRVIEHVSSFMTLRPGAVILTGTPAGVGFARRPPRFLRDGDVARVEIDGVGVLENPVRREAAPRA